MGDPLSAASLAKRMLSSLDRNASPQIKSPYDAIALACHAGMLAVGFNLRGLGEDHNIEAKQETNEPSPLPQEWNSSTHNSYAFRYSHPQSSMQFILKIGRLGGKATIDGIALGDDKRTSFDITVSDYVSPSSLPATPVSERPEADDQALRDIQNIFISPARLTDLASLLKINVIQKLVPSLQKEGYEETRGPPVTGDARVPEPNPGPAYDPPGRAEPNPARPNPFPYNDPLAAEPRRPFRPDPERPPDWDDEYDILRAPGRGGYQPRNPLSIGEQDLYPQGLGPNDPFRPSLGPGLGRPGGSGGMHPTFDDPLFGGRGGRGGDGFGDAQVPGGARYDPVGPGDPRGGPRFPGGMGGRPPNPFGGFGGGDFI